MVFVFQLIFRSNSTLSQSNSRGTQTFWSGADVLLLRKRPRFRGVWIFPPPRIASQTLVIVLIFVSCDVSVKVKRDRKVNWWLQGRVLPVRWHCQWRPPDSGGHVLEQLTQALLLPYTPSHHHGGQGQQPIVEFGFIFWQDIFSTRSFFVVPVLSFKRFSWVFLSSIICTKGQNFSQNKLKKFSVKILLQSSTWESK